MATGNGPAAKWLGANTRARFRPDGLHARESTVGGSIRRKKKRGSTRGLGSIVCCSQQVGANSQSEATKCALDMGPVASANARVGSSASAGAGMCVEAGVTVAAGTWRGKSGGRHAHDRWLGKIAWAKV